MKTFWEVIHLLAELMILGLAIYYLYHGKKEWAAIFYLWFCHTVDRDYIDELKEKVKKLENK